MIFESIEKKTINKITSVDVLNICRIYEKQEKFETTTKIKVKCDQVLRYGRAYNRTKYLEKNREMMQP